jgi:hypothetical protein
MNLTKDQINKICAAYLEDKWETERDNSSMEKILCHVLNPDYFPPSQDFWRLWDKVIASEEWNKIVWDSDMGTDQLVKNIPILVANYFLSLWNTKEGEKWFYRITCEAGFRELTSLGKVIKEIIDEKENT